MTRYRWLNADWPVNISTLVERIKTKPFTSDIRHGFVLDRVREDFVEARYIERIEFRDAVTDPFGNQLFFDRVEFRKSAFRVSTLQPCIELREPPRSIQPLINQLSELVDFQLAISTDTVNVLDWAEKVRSLSVRTSLIDSVQINSMRLKEGVTAKIIVKGTVDVRSSYEVLTRNRKYTVEKIQLRFDGTNNGSVILGASGTANFDIDDPKGELMFAVRAALIELTG